MVSLLINFPLLRQSVGVWIKIAAPQTELTDEQSELEGKCCQMLLLKFEPTDLDQGEMFFLPFFMGGN